MMDVLQERPVADIRMGPKQFMRVYGYNDVEPRLVEVRIHWYGTDDVLRLTVCLAEAPKGTLGAAIEKATARPAFDNCCSR